DDWTEHISSSGKKYYYNCRTEVSQWEKPKDLLEREQRQKDSVKMAANSFPRDMDYRQEALQDKATIASVDQSTAANCGHSSSSSQSLTPAAAAIGSTPSSMSSSSSSSSVQAPPSAQLPSPALLQDPALLHQLLPALQATLQMNNGSMDVAKLNEG
uniref:WW domain containing adaptor with coiled-coil b n=1 Tax=Neolamprologus brichardi TaxID=32507 RepID=A0A3Q4MHB8_NEOBR